jgi:hypothetical protein
MQNIILAPFFIVNDELHREPGAIGPGNSRWNFTITFHIAWVIRRFFAFVI